MVKICSEKVGEGKYTLEAVLILSDDGIQVYLGGGERSHIGTVVLSLPRPSLVGDGTISCTTSVLNLLHHKDDILAVALAETLCKKINKAVVVTAGVHIDQATRDDIVIFRHKLEEVADKLLSYF
ncbi:hypothetical protein JT05_12285 [Desulfosporosinus sp. Tol-M]|nr:hypothetical protein JT05_12285 [Desulfosporosinus sp. Tol-M]